MNMPKCVIYALTSSDAPDEIRYIGKITLSTDKRLALHISYAQKQRRTAVHRWICSHLDRGHTINILALKADAEWDGDEESIIAAYRARGARLLNILPGGQGTLGFRHSEEARRQRSEYMRRNTRGASASEKIAGKLRGRKRDPEAIEQQRLSVLGEKNHFFGKQHTDQANEANGRARAKLSDAEVLELRALYAAGEQQRDLARRFQISQAQVSAIINGTAYHWLKLEKLSRSRSSRDHKSR
jgi:hypothetical protein